MKYVFDSNGKDEVKEDDFEFIIEQLFLTLQENRHFWKLYFSIIMKSGIQNIVAEPIEQYLEPFIIKITEYYTKKGMKNPMENALVFGAMLDGISMNYILHPEMFPLEKIKKILINKFK